MRFLSRVHLLYSGQKNFGHGSALRESAFVFPAALLARQAIADAMIPLEAQAHNIGACERNRGFRNQAPSERNLSHQLAGDGAKTECARQDRDV